MPGKVLLPSLLVLVASLAITTPTYAGQQADLQAAMSLYKQHKYAPAADAFERVMRSTPSARVCYYAALSSRAAARELRARQLFQYIVAAFPQSPESGYAKTALAQAAANGVSGASNSTALPDNVVAALPPDMQKLLNSDMGKRALAQVMKEKPEQIATIRAADRQGLLTRENMAMATRSAGINASTNVAAKDKYANGTLVSQLPVGIVAAPAKAPAKEQPTETNDDHPFTAADIARDGAAGIDQSRYPNCWFEASMASLAELPRGQRLIAGMIRKRGDKYIVRFPGDGVEYTLTKDDLDQDGVHDSALWASIIECAQVKKFPHNKGANGAEGEQSRLDIGMGCITGARAEVTHPSNCSDTELSSFIGAAITSHNPIVASTWDKAAVADYPIIGQHAYTIIGFDPSKNMLTIRNPHGKNGRTFQLDNDPHHEHFQQLDNGMFRMDLKMFKRCFYQVARSFI